MKVFRTEVTLKDWEQKITHQDRLLAVGSCFSDNIGAKLNHFGFNTLINPFGTLFNPISIAHVLERSLNNRHWSISDISVNQDRWFCLETHGDLSATTQFDCLNRHNKALDFTNAALNKSGVLLITFGSAWVYEYKENQTIAANCHKLPSNQFRKRMLSVHEIVEVYAELIPQLTKNRKCKIVFTLSPVRHWKDGVVDNQQSKSTLHLAIAELQSQFNAVDYFPAYEIMMDDLRDYRFYDADMLHPNQQAVEYIWDKFKDAAIHHSCAELMSRIGKWRNNLAHRHIYPDSEGTIKFQKKLEQETAEIQKLLPNISL